MFTRVQLSANPGGGSSIHSTYDSLLWIDSIGLYQKMRSTYNMVHGIADGRLENYTLIEHNTKSIAVGVKPVAPTVKPAKTPGRLFSQSKTDCFFDLKGRVLNASSIRSYHHGIVIRKFSKDKFGIAAIIH
jgi:hypothetical protein